jgi:hypothetical protein
MAFFAARFMIWNGKPSALATICFENYQLNDILSAMIRTMISDNERWRQLSEQGGRTQKPSPKQNEKGFDTKIAGGTFEWAQGNLVKTITRAAFNWCWWTLGHFISWRQSWSEVAEEQRELQYKNGTTTLSARRTTDYGPVMIEANSAWNDLLRPLETMWWPDQNVNNVRTITYATTADRHLFVSGFI